MLGNNVFVVVDVQYLCDCFLWCIGYGGWLSGGFDLSSWFVVMFEIGFMCGILCCEIYVWIGLCVCFGECVMVQVDGDSIGWGCVMFVDLGGSGNGLWQILVDVSCEWDFVVLIVNVSMLINCVEFGVQQIVSWQWQGM